MPASNTRIGVCLTLLALSIATCSDRRVREVSGRTVDASDQDADDWTLVQTGDFNHDGLQDVLWNERGPNHQEVWLMSGTGVLKKGSETPGPIGNGWVAETAGDFNLDGMADVHWYNSSMNLMTVWLMNGTEVLRKGPEIPGPSGTGWTAVTAVDFNLDGIADLLWYNPTTNRMTVWLIVGTEVLQKGPEIPGPLGNGWTAVTAADLDLDGMGDVIWYNPTTNRMAVWLMGGTALLEAGPEIPGPLGNGWTAVTAADFDLDGIADVIWYNPTTNRMAVWLMRGTALLEAGPEIPGLGNDWKVAYAGDTNGDGMADALWQNSMLRSMAVWTMVGTHVVTPGPVIQVPPEE